MIMEHLTDFEMLLVGASIATFCFGFNAFIKNVCIFATSRLQSNITPQPTEYKKAAKI